MSQRLKTVALLVPNLLNIMMMMMLCGLTWTVCCELFDGVRLIQLRNGLRAMLISDSPAKDDDDSDMDEEMTEKSKRGKKRAAHRNSNSADNVMQVYEHDTDTVSLVGHLIDTCTYFTRFMAVTV